MAVLEGDGEEPVQLDEDHARDAQRQVDDEAVDVVGGGEDATVKETTGGTAAARRGEATAALHTRGRGAQYEDGRHGSRVDHAHQLIRPSSVRRDDGGRSR